MARFWNKSVKIYLGDLLGHDHMVVGLPMQSMPITTDVVISNCDQSKVYTIM